MAPTALARTAEHLKLLADPTRVRLLALLRVEELSVAELAQVLALAQPRVSTHLARLKEAGWVRDRRTGVQAWYSLATSAPQELLSAVELDAGPQAFAADRDRARQVVAARAAPASWAEQVAGDMERQYSPGRTWAAVARALTRLIRLGTVVDVASGDGVMAALLAPRAERYVCVDLSARVAEAARQRLAGLAQVEVRVGDMHALPLAAASVDTALLFQALPYSPEPARALAEAARVLKSGGLLIATTLTAHAHAAVVEPYGHRNLGLTPAALAAAAAAAGLAQVEVFVDGRESRPPFFETLTLSAQKP